VDGARAARTMRRVSPPVIYVARFQRTGAVALTAAGVASLAAVVWTLVSFRGNASAFPYAVAALAAFVALTGVGVTRLVRGTKNEWTALRIDHDGITFGAPFRRFDWDEINALVLFSRRTEFARGTVRCVGVRLHPYATDSPESHVAALRRTRSRSDLTEAERARLADLPEGPPGLDLELAVSFHTEARGWGFTRDLLKTAVRAHAPGVPVAERPAEDHRLLIGWRADREVVRRTAEEADLRHWR
jgi:hypothetical protein